MKFFTVALVLALAVAANASLYQHGAWSHAGSTAVHASNTWAAAPYASAWAVPTAAHWAAAPVAAHWGAPVATHWAAPVAAHWAAPAAAHWGSDDGQWRGDAPGHDGQWRGEGHWAGQDAHVVSAGVVAHTAPVAVVAAHHAAPVEHSASYVAANRGSHHVAPLPGHVQSVKSINVQPAPGTHW